MTPERTISLKHFHVMGIPHTPLQCFKLIRYTAFGKDTSKALPFTLATGPSEHSTCAFLY